MNSSREKEPDVPSAIRTFWSERRTRSGVRTATGELLAALWEFARDSTPSRLRSRFGDADYDWDFRVNTTSGAVGWRDRLLGALHSPYQPTEPGLFHEMMESLQQQTNADLADYTFIDLGSGKGRTLLMASEYPFRKIVGVELLSSLHRIAQGNIEQYKSASQRCFDLESICADATNWALPAGQLVIYLFNPFPEAGLRRALANLKNDLAANPRAAYVLYHNPQLEHVLSETAFLTKIGGTHQFSIFAGAGDGR